MQTFVYGIQLNVEGAAALGRYRHQIFVEQLGWDLPLGEAAIERDQYDRDDTVYVVARDDEGTLLGCARLLRTTSPYMLKDLFSGLLDPQMPAPESPYVWELSRFAARPDAAVRPNGAGMAWGVRPMLTRVVQCALQLQAQCLIGVTFVSMERLFRRIGVQVHRAGPVRSFDGRKVVACWIDIDEQTLSALDIDRQGVATRRLQSVELPCSALSSRAASARSDTARAPAAAPSPH